MEERYLAHVTVKAENVNGRRFVVAFLYAVPISLLGGLVGLGGAEFRLPVLVGPLGLPLRRAVPLNLAISLVTLVVAFITRGRSLSWASLSPWLLAVLSLSVGAIAAASYGVTLTRRLSDELLARVLMWLLVGVGCSLVISGVLPQKVSGLIPMNHYWHIGTGLLCGAAVGLVSSTGIAGGQLMITVLVFLFGVNVKTAGTASLLINLPKVSVVVGRYVRQGAYALRSDLLATMLPMSLGSIAGATAGGLLVGVVPAELLKTVLGLLLILSSVRAFHKLK